MEESTALILRFVRANHSHGERAIHDLITTLINTGLTKAACGSLDLDIQDAIKNLLLEHILREPQGPPSDLDKIAREIHWGEKFE